MSAEDVRAALAHDECHEQVTRAGLYGARQEPCELTACALRYDDEGLPYPVCARHARAELVPLAELRAALESG